LELDDWLSPEDNDRGPPPQEVVRLKEYEELPTWHKRIADAMLKDKKLLCFFALVLFRGKDPEKLYEEMFEREKV